jgi:Uma2 family endonuclease
MPAGGLHGQLLAYIVELLRHWLETRGLMFLVDVFLLYRDTNGRKQRISPDLLLMPFRFPPPSAYDLDYEPPPLCVIEVTSPGSHLADLQNKVPFYLGLGIATYLAIDAVTSSGRLRDPIELHLWRLISGRPQAMQPDPAGELMLPEMGFRVSARGQRLRFVDARTGEVAQDSGELLAALETERQTRMAERQARMAERQARLKAEAEAARLRAELRKLRGPDDKDE